MVRWRLSITLFFIFAVATAGRVVNGDIGTAIEKWIKYIQAMT